MLERAQKTAAAIVDQYFSAHSTPPAFWDELVRGAEEATREELVPGIQEVERRCATLYERFQKHLPSGSQQEILKEFADTWIKLSVAESDAAFLLGIAMGKRLARHHRRALRGGRPAAA
jgi:hypothetical protein